MENLVEQLTERREIEPTSSKSAWEKVRTARDNNRPQSMEIINNIFTGFFELYGDRNYSNDSSIVGGLAWLKDVPVTVIGQQKGIDLPDRLKRNFGMTNPEGYRKSLRLVKQAEKFKRPVICFVDTPGAFCGVEAEKKGQAYAIANNLHELFGVKTPIVTVVLGEGGSGGALALSVCDKLYMFENSVFSVITPEGCASILWKDAKLAREAAEKLRLTAADLYEAGFVDDIIREPEDFTRDNMIDTCAQLKELLYADIRKLSKLNAEALIKNRQNKYLGM